MRAVVIIFLVTLCGVFTPWERPALAQGPAPKGATVGFRNEVKAAFIVQGHSIALGMQVRGQPMLLDYGKMAFESNLPHGVRYYTVYDRNQPARVLLRDFPVPVEGDLFLSIRAVPNMQGRVTLVPGPPP